MLQVVEEHISVVEYYVELDDSVSLIESSMFGLRQSGTMQGCSRCSDSKKPLVDAFQQLTAPTEPLDSALKGRHLSRRQIDDIWIGRLTHLFCLISPFLL